MQKYSVKADLSDPQVEAFVFFVLSLDEQLHDYTDDSYKAPALNTYSRTLELQSLALTNHSAGIGQDALKPFVEELEWSVARDPALNQEQKALCRVHIQNIRNELSAADRVSKGIAGLRISLGNYFASVKEQIKECITIRPKNKSDLSNLASTFIVQAETIGFPRRHTYHTARNVLLYKIKKSQKIDIVGLLDKFFEQFEHKEDKFICAFIVSGDAPNFKTLMERYSFKITEEQPNWEGLTDQHQEFLSSAKPGERFLICTDPITSHSPAHAHEVGMSIFETMLSVMRYFEHKLSLSISNRALIHNLEEKKTFMIRNPPDPMQCWTRSEAWVEKDVLSLADTVHGYHLFDDSAHRLARAIKYHRAALLSNSPENQLVDLWAGLEGLLPQPKRERSRVEFYVESILPSLTLTYPEKLLRSAYGDVLTFAPSVSAIYSELKPNCSPFFNFVALLLCAEHEKERGHLIELIKRNPLLLNRVWRVAQRLSTREAIRDTLRNHRTKVQWHIQRIYAARNSIMHSASSLPYLRSLVENLHVYVDTLIGSISRVAIISPEKLSIEGALQYLSSWEKYRFESIASGPGDATAQLTIENVWGAVFASDMALAPTESRS